MDVGVRDLKQHLSEYLDRVERGETIRVTDRGRPKALISPLATDAALERGVEEGWLRPARTVGLAPAKRYRSRRAIRDVLAEDRGE